LKFSPAIAVVTNIDREHLDFYPDMAAIKSVFFNFIDRIPFYGLAILCLDNEPIQDLIPYIKKRYMTYGMNSQADLQIRDVEFEKRQSHFTVVHDGQKLGRITLNLPGLHNVYNATAGIAVGLELNVPLAAIKKALESLEGVQRRLEIKGKVGGITVVDDYGHHPTEIKTTLDALEKCWPERRKIIVFQPHRYSRTQALFDDFTRAFYQSDVLLVLPIYAASEMAIEGVSGQLLCEGIQAHGHKEVYCAEGMPNAVDYLKQNLRPDDVLLTLGAGDVWKVGEQILEEMK
jgi:UDP-N-acetylmuramate--alanine ligase